MPFCFFNRKDREGLREVREVISFCALCEKLCILCG